MSVGMCLYAQLVQIKNKQCKSAIILQCHHPHLSDFCSQPQLTQPYNHIIYPGVAKIYLVFFWKCLLYLLILLFVASCSIHLKNISLSKSESSAPNQMQEKKNTTNETRKSCPKILMPIGNSIYQAHTKQYLKTPVKQMRIVSTKWNAG